MRFDWRRSIRSDKRNSNNGKWTKAKYILVAALVYLSERDRERKKESVCVTRATTHNKADGKYKANGVS